jgi:hypothetical protein
MLHLRPLIAPPWPASAILQPSFALCSLRLHCKAAIPIGRRRRFQDPASLDHHLGWPTHSAHSLQHLEEAEEDGCSEIHRK